MLINIGPFWPPTSKSLATALCLWHRIMVLVHVLVRSTYSHTDYEYVNGMHYARTALTTAVEAVRLIVAHLAASSLRIALVVCEQSFRLERVGTWRRGDGHRSSGSKQRH